MSRLQGADANIRIAVHDPGADYGGHVALAAPGMRGGALQPEIIPGIETTRRIGRHDRESVQSDG